MIFNFKKISAIGASALLTGMTMGVAAAASYPQPFIVGGTANVAIVYGTGAGVSALDAVQAGNIQSNLQSFLPSGTTSTGASGGDSYLIEKTSTKFHIGDGISDVISVAITDDNLPTLLADGKFIDADNDEFDYTQKVNMANLSVTLWEDNDYKADDPTIGVRISSGSHILNYTLDFSDEPLWADLDTSTIPFMGKEYYILSHVTNTTLTLLDSATDTTLVEGETTNLDVEGTSYQVSIAFIGGTGIYAEVKLNVNGELTNSLGESETYKLSDESYVGIKDILVQDYAGGIKQVEFSIGNGKLKLVSGSDIEINDDSISDLTVYFTNSAEKLQKVVLEWDAEDDLFVTTDSEVTMPGFEAIKLSYAGEIYPAEEKITVKPGSDTYFLLDNFPLKDSVEDIVLLYYNGSEFDYIGKDSDNQLRTVASGNLTFNGNTDDYFVASWSDGSDAESYLMKATNFKIENTINKTTLQYRVNGIWTDKKTDAQDDDTISIGSVELRIGPIDKSGKTVVIEPVGAYVDFHTLYSKEGMKVYLPFNSSSSTAPGVINLTNNPSDFSLILSEEDKNENIGDGENVTLTLSENAVHEASVTGITGGSASNIEIGDTDIFRNIVYSALATEIMWDKSADQYDVVLTYHGDETRVQLYVSAPETTVTSTIGGATLGDVLVKDTEISSVSSKNLVIVGGSCINSVAAKVLGVAQHTCGAAFTSATGIGSGEFLIKGVSGAYTTGKIALVVAGYEAADTVNAATYLRTQTIDTSKTYKGTSSTSAILITTTA